MLKHLSKQGAHLNTGMAGYVLSCELRAPVPIDKAFEVFENPYNLARITPPNLGFQILTANLVMNKGTEIDYEFRWLALPFRWKTRITVYNPPSIFVDEAVRSPYSFWRHEHRFRQTPEGTIISDQVHYGMRMGFVGQAVHGAIVSRQLTKIFAYRQEAIRKLLGGTADSIRHPTIEKR